MLAQNLPHGLPLWEHSPVHHQLTRRVMSSPILVNSDEEETPRRSFRVRKQRVQLDQDDVVSDDESSDDFEEQPKKKQKRGKSTAKVSTPSLEDENRLFIALSSADVAISEIASSWVQEYKEDRDEAVVTLINFVLRCCGCVAQVQKHDVTNLDSAAETVGELQIMFQQQKFHEYPLQLSAASSKQANENWKHFKSNVGDFICQIVVCGCQDGVLMQDELYMESILVWLSSISTSTMRPLRFCATFLLLNIETTLCDEIVTKTSSITRFEKQLKNAKGETRNKIQKNITQFTEEKAVLEDLLKDISNTTFIHRYRDVDPKIREECIISLCQWMIKYAEFFFESSYLRYFGWLLSDSNAGVRTQVLRSLIKLYKIRSMTSGLRQFTERFKPRLLELCFHDVDVTVRTLVVDLFAELSKLGFLEDAEIEQIMALWSKEGTLKFQQALTKFTLANETDWAKLVHLVVEIPSLQNLGKNMFLMAKFSGPEVVNSLYGSIEESSSIPQVALLSGMVQVVCGDDAYTSSFEKMAKKASISKEDLIVQLGSLLKPLFEVCKSTSIPLFLDIFNPLLLKFYKQNSDVPYIVGKLVNYFAEQTPENLSPFKLFFQRILANQVIMDHNTTETVLQELMSNLCNSLMENLDSPDAIVDKLMALGETINVSRMLQDRIPLLCESYNHNDHIIKLLGMYVIYGLELGVSQYVDEICQILKDEVVALKNETAAFTLIDILVSIFVFEENNPDVTLHQRVDGSLEGALLDMFLEKEYHQAKILRLQLDRDEDEDVNFPLDEELNEDQPQWEGEKELCVFSLKMKLLAKANYLGEKAVNRLVLNKGLLGGLFAQLMEDVSVKG